jgi:hypothetical protein
MKMGAIRPAQLKRINRDATVETKAIRIKNRNIPHNHPFENVRDPSEA